MEFIKKPFSSREWFLATVILALIQGGVWYVAFIHAKSTTALNYVSFAGTIISIILAVLAIVYTYLDSAASKTQGDTLANQIVNLGKVIETIKIEADALSQISGLKKDLLTLSANFTAGITNTQQGVEDVKKIISQLAQNTVWETIGQISPNKATGYEQTRLTPENQDNIITVLTKNPTAPVKGAFLILLFLQKQRKGISPTALAPLFAKAAERTGSSDETAHDLSLLYTGLALALNWILWSNGLATVKDGAIHLDAKLTQKFDAWLQEKPVAGADSPYFQVFLSVVIEFCVE